MRKQEEDDEAVFEIAKNELFFTDVVTKPNLNRM